jgi:hypothetical protein
MLLLHHFGAAVFQKFAVIFQQRSSLLLRHAFGSGANTIADLTAWNNQAQLDHRPLRGVTRGDHAISAAGSVFGHRGASVKRIDNRRQNGSLSTVLIRMTAIACSRQPNDITSRREAPNVPGFVYLAGPRSVVAQQVEVSE